MHLFYTPDITSADRHLLTEEESKHCSRVLRLIKGDVVHLTDGKGSLFESVIEDDRARKIPVRITQTFNDWEQRPYRLHIAIAPTKNINRFEWLLEKATEIGIDEITPLICEHAERKSIHMERMNKILIAAMKQSLKANLPKLNDPLAFASLIRGQDHYKKYIAHYDAAHEHLRHKYAKGENALVLIGPEGDFSQQEINDALLSGFTPVNLGNSRLRTETAGVVACSVIGMINS